MSEIATIEIDFDIHKRIEMERQSFTESPNDVLRRLLGLGPPTKHETRLENHVGAWSGKGVTLPAGTRLRMEYRGNTHLGEIRDGAWFLEGKRFTSPSAAAGGVALTKAGNKASLDGWRYWWVKRPSDADWVSLSSLRKTRKRVRGCPGRC